MSRQLPITFPTLADYSKESFRSGESTQEAERVLERYPDWPRRSLLIIGGAASGKTHIGHIWAARQGALKIETSENTPDFFEWKDRALWIDDAETAGEDILFTALNMAMTDEAQGVLLTAKSPPAEWGIVLPDLISRLGTVTVVRLDPPDDALLAGIFEKLFLERGIKPGMGVIDYLLLRTERSVPAAAALVDALDHAAASQKANLTRAFAAKFFDQQSELF